MAEFQEVIKHWGRMLDAHRHGESIAIEASVPADAFKDAKLVEEIVMEWAAEHPGPVYPTWAEWLLKVGAARRVPIGEPWPVEFPDGSMLEPCCETVVKENERIPADLAQKLGIEPEEG